MKIAFPDTGGMNVYIHIGFAVFRIYFFKTSEEFGAVVLLESVCTQIVQHFPICLWNPVKCREEGSCDRDARIPGLFLPVYFDTGMDGFKSFGEDPSCCIASQTEAILLLLGYEGEIPSYLPGMIRK